MHKRKYNALIGLFPVFANDNKRAVLQRQVSHFAHVFIFCKFETKEIKQFDSLQILFIKVNAYWFWHAIQPFTCLEMMAVLDFNGKETVQGINSNHRTFLLRIC